MVLSKIFEFYILERPYKALQNIVSILLIMVIVMRFKRVEVQVVEGNLENTYYIFKKIKYLRQYFVCSCIVYLIYQTGLIVNQVY